MKMNPNYKTNCCYSYVMLNRYIYECIVRTLGRGTQQQHLKRALKLLFLVFPHCFEAF